MAELPRAGTLELVIAGLDPAIHLNSGNEDGCAGQARRMTKDENESAMTIAREAISDKLAAVGYVADRDIATALWLMEFLKRPLLLEGEAGVGKTEVGKALAAVHASELIRLQCYEGLDQNAALYEWNYQRQLLAIKTREGIGENADAIEEHIFSEKYLWNGRSWPPSAASRRRYC